VHLRILSEVVGHPDTFGLLFMDTVNLDILHFSHNVF